MIQRNKEELIEFFIEQLGDNEILGKYMTIDQMREKLNRLIKDVTYNSQQGTSFSASWNYNDGIVNFDNARVPGTEAEKSIIVHELLHVLSSSETELSTESDNSYKVGVHYYDTYKKDNEIVYFWSQNTAINEGITDYLAEKITGYRSLGYRDEKDIYNALSIIIGEETMLQKYFSDIVPWNPRTYGGPIKIFEMDLIQKYGLDFGKDLNNGVKKILELSDQLNDFDSKDRTYGLSEYAKGRQKQTKEEIYATLYQMLEKVINNENNIENLVEINNSLGNFKGTIVFNKLQDVIANAISKRLVDSSKTLKDRVNVLNEIMQNEDALGKFSERILTGIINNDDITNEEKLDIFRNIPKINALLIDENIHKTLGNIVFSQSDISLYEKMKSCKELNLRERVFAEQFYREATKEGIINEETFCKRDLVMRAAVQMYIYSKQEININDFGYFKYGEDFILTYKGKELDSTIIIPNNDSKYKSYVEKNGKQIDNLDRLRRN